MLSQLEISCGARQLTDFGGYTSPAKFLYDSLLDEANDFSNYFSDLDDYDNPPLRISFKFILFSDIASKKHEQTNTLTGTKFVKFVLDSSLGTILATPLETNPNTHNKIKIWIWQIHIPKLRKWYKNYQKLNGR